MDLGVMNMENEEDVKHELKVELEAIKSRIASLEKHELLQLPKDVRHRIALLHNKADRTRNVLNLADMERVMALERLRKRHAHMREEYDRSYVHEENDQSTTRDFALFLRAISGVSQGFFENFFVYVLLLFQRLRSGTGAAPSLKSLHRLFDWWPTKKLRERSQEMIVEAQVRITMFHKKGRLGVARWIKFCTVVRCVWMIVKSPVTMVVSAVMTYLFGKPG
jgi:hypothetical protein